MELKSQNKYNEINQKDFMFLLVSESFLLPFYLYLGLVPYPGLNGIDILKALKEGYRLEQPPGCSDKM